MGENESKNKYISREEIAACVDEQLPDLRDTLIEGLYRIVDDYHIRQKWEQGVVDLHNCNRDAYGDDDTGERWMWALRDEIGRTITFIMRDMNKVEAEKSPKFKQQFERW